MNIYKQVYDLNLTDLQKYPVWEYVLEDIGLPEQTYSTVRPYLSSLPDIRHTMLIVRTTFILANGRKLMGIIKPIQLGKDPHWGEPLIPVDHFPVIVTDNGQVVFHYGTRKPEAEEIAHNYKLLRYSSHEVFPITYRSDIEIEDCILRGAINGFMYLDNSKKGFDQIIRLKPTDIQLVT